MFGKKVFVILSLLFMIVACSSEESEQPSDANNIEEDTTENQQEDTDSEQETGEENEAPDVADQSVEATTEQLTVPEQPPIPTTFREATDYPVVGEFSGDISYDSDEYANYPELVKALQEIPPITIEDDEGDIEKVKRYIYSLFKENLTLPDAPLEQWKSMQFDNPEAGEDGVQLKEAYRVAILLDSSGSMGFMEGDQTRMALAKQAINDFVSKLPKQATVSLHVYGHVGTGSESDKEKSCASIDEVYPLGTYEKAAFDDALDQFDPAGWTPMAGAIEQVEQDFSDYKGSEGTTIIYVVSDGVETCDGDPVQAISSLNESSIDPVVNIIGYQVDNEGLEQLKEMAEASEGRYINAKSHEDLKTEFQKTVDMSELWAQWHSESKDIIRDLHSTIKHHLYEWNNKEKEKTYRQNENLKHALKYLHEEEILDLDTYLNFSDELRDNYLNIADEQRAMYSELYDINQETYEEKFSEVEERFERARE